MANAVAHAWDAVGVYRVEGDRLFACEVRLLARGEAFEASYTEGDNSLVVATDSMKNFIHRQALAYREEGLEDFLVGIGERFLERYDQAEAVELRARRRCSRAAGDPCCSSSTTIGRRGDDAPFGRHAARAVRPERPAPRQAARQLLRRLPARRVHDAPRRPRPAALRPSGRVVAQRRLRAAGRRRGSAASRDRVLQRLRVRLDSAPRPRDGRAGTRPASPRSTTSPSGRRTACGTRRWKGTGSPCTRTPARRSA